MLINGVSEAKLAINDRGLSYGDGLFETILLHKSQPVYLAHHLKRLINGCRLLAINCDFERLSEEIHQLSETFPFHGILKIVVTRGVGGRGYRPGHSLNASRILSLHSLPDYSAVDPKKGVQVFLCKQRLAHQASLAGIKHLNRLEQVLASMEWPDDEYFEGIMLDAPGNVIEGTKSNLFFAEAGKLITPDLKSCGIQGVMRKILIDNFNDSCNIEECSIERLLKADEAFICNSIFGVLPIKSLLLEKGKSPITFTPASFCQKAIAVFEQGLTNDNN